MRKLLFVCTLLISAMAAAKSPVIVYNGDTLLLSKEFVRTQCGTVKKSMSLPEISGIACSRVTPGYLWMESDDYKNVVATTEKGVDSYLRLSFTGIASRGDWEDMCGGVYQGKDYLFIGAFGDNNETTGKSLRSLRYPPPQARRKQSRPTQSGSNTPMANTTLRR